MTDFFQRNEEICTLHEWGMNLSEISRLYGISRTRVWQITIRHPQFAGRQRAERDQKRRLARQFYAVLPLIEKAAIKAAKKWHPPPPPPPIRKRYEKWQGPPRRPPTWAERQAAMQERAKLVHWSRVVYANGTDIVVDILPGY